MQYPLKMIEGGSPDLGIPWEIVDDNGELIAEVLTPKGTIAHIAPDPHYVAHDRARRIVASVNLLGEFGLNELAPNGPLATTLQKLRETHGPTK